MKGVEERGKKGLNKGRNVEEYNQERVGRKKRKQQMEGKKKRESKRGK